MNVENYIWWLWMVLAGVFIVIEILTPGFFLLWFGIGAAAAGLVALAGAGMTWQLLTFAVVTVVLLVFSRSFAERVTRGSQALNFGVDRLLGKEGIVIEEINNLKNTGKVRVQQDEWRADSSIHEEVIPAGEVIEVVKIEGTHLVVTKVVKGE